MSGCGGSNLPAIEIQPENALADENVKIQVLDLQSMQIITLRATMKDDVGLDWESYACIL
jgi:hypothetical protein